MNLRVFDSIEELQRAVARTLLQRIAVCDRAAIGISGGSTPKGLYAMLGAPPWREELAGHKITWVVVDERHVPRDDPQSNARMIEETLFGHGLAQDFLAFRTELNDPAETARAFESEWHARAIGELEVAILGVGDDGHTASLFPGTPVLEVEDRVAAEVFVPRLSQWRVTLTKPVLRAAKLRIVLATGAAKAPVLRDVKAGVRHPIAIVTDDVETWWFVDREAAS